ncbi:hypothetical protein ONZ45_g12632 [Pleurotus djamor]|nr:hypothetical protein ONZ45_g12632 [Pleurotus djamor]
MNGAQPFYILAAVSSAMPALHLSSSSTLDLFPQCGKKYDAASDVLTINPSAEEEERMHAAMTAKRLAEPPKKSKKRKAKDDAGVEGDAPATKKKAAAPSTNPSVAAVSKAVVDSRAKEEAKRKSEMPEMVKSLYGKDLPKKKETFMTMGTFTRRNHLGIKFQNSASYGHFERLYDAPRAFDAASFAPLNTLDALGDTKYTTFGHPAFPNHSVRVKKTNFCDPTVNSYTGYIDIEARHLFFYFFESRNNPDSDDVVFWTNGGPGGSSAMGLFMELGPCRIVDEKGPTFHPESWNSNANIFFIDQPIGVGFSYAEFGEYVSTTEEAAQDVAAFVAIFFENFTKFKGRGFHFSGESYAGRYLPLFAAAVYDKNPKLIELGMTPINLSSVMIGNGMTDFYSMIPAYAEFQCTNASVAPVQSISACVKMKQMLPRCLRWFKSSCIDHFDLIDCNAAIDICHDAVEVPFTLTGRSPYDISKACEGEHDETLCYPATLHVRDYLSRPDVRTMLGVDPSVREKFVIADPAINAAFGVTVDIGHPTVDHIAALLERGVRVLIYVGSYDWVCNWLGNMKWTLDMEWSGKEAFGKMALVDWMVNGTSVGKMRNAKGFTFATVPYDKPAESLEMVKRWMSDQPL